MASFIRIIEEKIEQRDESIVVKQSMFWAKFISWSLMGGTCFAIGWLCIAKTEEVVIATGKLEPKGGVINIQMPLQGIAEQIEVKDGDRVKKGQILIKLDTESSADREMAARINLKLKNKEYGFKNEELKQTMLLLNQRITKLESNLKYSRSIMDRFEYLKILGAASELQYIESKQKVNDLERELEMAKTEKNRQVTVLRQQIKKIESELQTLKAQLTDTEVTIRYQNIVAPVDGIVFDSKVLAPGFVARSTEPILKIVPLDKLQAKVNVPTRSIGFIKTGNDADISIDSFPATDFGVIEGVVKKIGSDALPPKQGESEGYYFPTVIELNEQRLILRNGKTLPLQVGMSLTANIKLRKVSYMQLLLGGFKDKADSLREI